MWFGKETTTTTPMMEMMDAYDDDDDDAWRIGGFNWGSYAGREIPNTTLLGGSCLSL